MDSPSNNGLPPLIGSDTPSTMDGLSAPSPAPAPLPLEPPAPAAIPELSGPAVPPAPQVKAAKRFLGFVSTILIVGYVGWCGLLLSVFPNAAGDYKDILQIGLLSCLVGAGVFLLVGFIGMSRVGASHASVALKQRSLIKLCLLVIPGVLLSAIVPIMIVREPTLSMDVTSPADLTQLVAPVSVTFSLQSAVDVLRKRGLKPVKYIWDTDGDGQPNDETVIPTSTALFDKQGTYIAAARIVFDDGTYRRITRRIVVPQAVFSMAPTEPIVEKPVQFSIAHLVTDAKTLTSVTWTFGDGTDPVQATETETLHTYFAIGEYPVSVLIQLANKTQIKMDRTITVSNPPPLPFPVTLTTEPQNLMGPAPFGVLFEMKTDEQLREVQWDFGDGKVERGAALTRVGHSYDRQGIFPVVTRVRSASGQLAEITTIVRVTPSLILSDLSFTGQPPVKNYTVTGEAPLRVSLTPKTSAPLVHFQWETTATGEVVITGEKVEGIYRKPGTYTITLIGQDSDGKVLRQPVTIQVDPPSAEPTILVKPDGGVAPLLVAFDASQSFIPNGEKIAGFKWSFGDENQNSNGNEELGTARVEHLYKGPGDYTVTLTVVMASGKEFTANRTIVIRKPALSACLTTSRVRVQAGKGVEFDSSCSSGSPNGYLWDVRYDTQPDVVLAQSSDPTYVYVFDTPGQYTVNLTVKDQWGTQDQKSVSITVTP